MSKFNDQKYTNQLKNFIKLHCLSPLFLILDSMSSQKSIPTTPTKSLQNQQFQELTYTIQIKQKKIIYLQQQIRSIKEQCTRKLQRAQNQYENLRKQNETIQRKVMDQKQQHSKFWGQRIKSISEQYRQNSSQKQEFYQNLIKQKEIKSTQLLVEFQLRYDNIIKQLKLENQKLQNILINKQNSHMEKKQKNAMTFGNDDNKRLKQKDDFINDQHQNNFIQTEDRAEMIKQKLSLIQQLFTTKKTCEKLAKQLQFEKRSIRKLEGQQQRKSRQYEQKISLLKMKIQKLQEKIFVLQEQRNSAKSKYEHKIVDLQEQNQQMKAQLKQSNKSYLKLLQTRTQHQSPQPITTIKSCNHAGLILQMQKNLELKINQISTLKDKLAEWQKIFGFDKNIDQRLGDLGNASNRTQRVYREQKQKLQSGTDRLNKKVGKNNK